MADVHSIRLHGPWQASLTETLVSAGESEPEQRVKIPSDWSAWLGISFRGRVRFTRRFGRPTGLLPNQKVWLVIEEVDYRGTVYLNGQPLGGIQLGGPPLRIEVGSELQKSNQLQIDIELPIHADRGDRSQNAGGLIGGVRLEIDDSADSL